MCCPPETDCATEIVSNPGRPAPPPLRHELEELLREVTRVSLEISVFDRKSCLGFAQFTAQQPSSLMSKRVSHTARATSWIASRPFVLSTAE